MICHRRGNSQADANKRHNAHYGQCPAFHLVFLRIRSLQTHQTHCLDPTLWRGDGRPHEGPQHTLGGHLSAISAYLIAPKSIVSRIIVTTQVGWDPNAIDLYGISEEGIKGFPSKASRMASKTF